MTIQPLWPVLLLAIALLACTLVWALRTWNEVRGRDRALLGARALLAGAAVVIGLHPVGTVRVDVAREPTTDLVLVIDRTTSMGARDWNGEHPRMDGVAADLQRLVTAAAGARIAVIVFDDDARLAVPFTTDATAVISYVRTIGWRPTAKASGSDVSVAADLVEEVLARAAADRPDHQRYVVYAGDGEQTAESPPGSFEASRPTITDALVLGYGTVQGAAMTIDDQSENLVRIDGEVQRSHHDEAALTAIAEQFGGTYVHRTSPGAVPEFPPARAAATVSELQPSREVYWIVAIAAGVGLLVLLWSAVAAARSAREEVTHAP